MRILVVLMLLLAGCTQTTTGSDDVPGESAEGVWTSGHKMEGQAAPMYSASALIGEPDVQAHDGKVRLLTVWAYWCSICGADEANWVKLQEQFPDDLAVIAISRDPDVQRAQDHADGRGWSFATGIDESVNSAFGIRNYQPNLVLIDRNGTMVSIYEGPIFNRPGGYGRMASDVQALI